MKIRRLLTRKKSEHYRVQDGAIVDERGCVLYEAFSIADLSDAAKARLARLHTIDPDLEWEGNSVEGRKGAWDILIAEGLMPVVE